MQDKEKPHFNGGLEFEDEKIQADIEQLIQQRLLNFGHYRTRKYTFGEVTQDFGFEIKAW